MKTILRVVLLISIIIFACVGVYAFTQNSSLQKDNKLQVAASFYPMYYFASEIGGDRATVRNITPSGAEPHDFEPTAKDIASIEASKLLVINGANVEAWYPKIENELKQNSVQIVVASEGLTTLEGTDEHEHEGEEHSAGEPEEHIQDPHVWLNPVLAQKEVEKIRDGFIAADPSGEAYYNANTQSLLERLQSLDKKYREGLASCEREDIVTSHTAFAYLAKEYGLHQVAISGLSTSAEPSTQELAEVAQFAREHQVKYIFFESLISPKLSETIATEIGAETLVLDPIEGIPDDEMAQGKNYFTVMEDNLTNLQTALACSN